MLCWTPLQCCQHCRGPFHRPNKKKQFSHLGLIERKPSWWVIFCILTWNLFSICFRYKKQDGDFNLIGSNKNILVEPFKSNENNYIVDFNSERKTKITNLTLTIKSKYCMWQLAIFGIEIKSKLSLRNLSQFKLYF